MLVEERPVTFDSFPLGPSVEYASKSALERSHSSVSYLQPSDGVVGGSKLEQLFGVRCGSRAVLIETYSTDHSAILFGSLAESKSQIEGFVEGDAAAATLWKAMKLMMRDAEWKAEAAARIAGETAG
jgi:hypothetical protein